MEEEVDKLKVAEVQLITAIKLFFENGHVVAIHTLARASHEILDNLCAHKNITRGVISEGLKNIKPEHHKKVLTKINEAKNFFKHADKDPESLLLWNPGVSEYFIWDATSLHRRLTGNRQVGEILTYSLWFRLHHNDLWDKQSISNFDFDKILLGARSELECLSKEEFFQISMTAWRNGGFGQTI